MSAGVPFAAALRLVLHTFNATDAGRFYLDAEPTLILRLLYVRFGRRSAHASCQRHDGKLESQQC